MRELRTAVSTWNWASDREFTLREFDALASNEDDTFIITDFEEEPTPIRSQLRTEYPAATAASTKLYGCAWWKVGCQHLNESSH